MTMLMSLFVIATPTWCVVDALNLQERRTRKTSRRQQQQRNRPSDRTLQITLWPDQTTVTSTNSSTSFPTLSPIITSTVVTSVDPALVDPKSCKSGKGRTCTPSTRPSVAPSESPSISHMPTISFQPSARPSISSRPSLMPSSGPTPLPSSSPSLDPSPQPSEGPTQVPTISSPPTIIPSTPPSSRPSPSPTIEPTISSQPTITARPSMAPVIDPNGVIDRIVTDDAGNTGVESQCRRDLPSTATRLTDQLIVYEYDITTTTGADVAFVTDTIATQVQKEMSRQFLTCTFNATEQDASSFDTTTVSSLPFDAVATTTSNCTTADGTVADCYRINAAFTATIFYVDDATRRRFRNRMLQQNTTTATNTTTTGSTPSDVITDPVVAEQFSSSLQSLFDSGQFASDIVSVKSTEFQGLANAADTNDTNTDDAIPPTDDDSQTDKSLSGGQVAGSVIGTFIGLALIAIIVVFVVTRRRNTNDNNNNKSRAMDVTQEDFHHDLNAEIYNEEYDERDDRAMMDRSIIASDDGSYDSGYTGKIKTTTAAYIIDDDQDTLYTRDFPNPTEPSFSDRIRSAEQPGPTFVKTNEVLYQMNKQNEMDEMEFALERSLADGGGRDYNAPDTVQL